MLTLPRSKSSAAEKRWFFFTCTTTGVGRGLVEGRQRGEGETYRVVQGRLVACIDVVGICAFQAEKQHSSPQVATAHGIRERAPPPGVLRANIEEEEEGKHRGGGGGGGGQTERRRRANREGGGPSVSVEGANRERRRREREGTVPPR